MNLDTRTRAPVSASTSEPRYRDALAAAMAELASEPRTYFLGQAVACPGTAIYGTLDAVPIERRHELPVMEECQMGMTLGLALAGWIPVSIYPRLNFLLLAVNQLVNHVDKLATMSRGGYRPHLIIRSSIGSVRPLDPQEQHRGDYSRALAAMCPSIRVRVLDEPGEIIEEYRRCLRAPGAHLMIEWADSLAER